MNQRERFLATMRFEQADRVPLHELGLWGQTVDEFLKAGMPEQAATENLLVGNDFLGLDRREFVPVYVGPLPPFDFEKLEEDERYVVFRDGDGTVHKALKEGTVRGTRLSMDQYIKFAVETPADFAEMKKRYNPASPQRYPADWGSQVARWKTRDCPLCLLQNASFGFYSMARRWMGTENLSLAFYDYPAMMHEMMEFFADFFIEVTHRALHDIDCDYFSFFEDMAGKGGPLMGPELFRTFILPHYKRVIRFLRDHGVDIIWVDSDGDMNVLLPLLIEAGVTCHWPLEVAAGMDPLAIRRRYGKSLALSGGVDKRELAKGRREIERELLKTLPPLLETGGYIPTVDHTVPPDVPCSNFMYYIDLKRKIVEGKFGA